MDLEMLCFQMISASGGAKSFYMEALQAAKEGNYEQAEELIKKGEESFAEGHHSHTELIQKECAGEKTTMTLLLTHVEDQMMSAEVIKYMAEEMIQLYKEVRAK